MCIFYRFICFTYTQYVNYTKNQFVFHFLDSDFMDEAEFTFSKRGFFHLIHDGYTFHKRDSQTNKQGSIVWRCDLYRAHKNKCKAVAFTKTFDCIDRVKFLGEHNHPPSQ